jgi:hypothetical protein
MAKVGQGLYAYVATISALCSSVRSCSLAVSRASTASSTRLRSERLRCRVPAPAAAGSECRRFWKWR